MQTSHSVHDLELGAMTPRFVLLARRPMRGFAQVGFSPTPPSGIQSSSAVRHSLPFVPFFLLFRAARVALK